ncbi:ATP-binding cassette domain-containing protein [Pararhodobacter oceanensis]|uniref:ATP-binding cassette domain-containing protein n=1 Tax=Pararhodobacter oceanensis TaxID=2172121 RepID=UPI003A951274
MSETKNPPPNARLKALLLWIGPESQRRLQSVWAFGVFAAVFEALSLGAIIPVMGVLVSDSDTVSIAGFAVPPLALGTGLLLLHAIGLGLRAISVKRMVLVHHQVGYRCAAAAYGKVLDQSMAWHTDHHSGETQAVLLGNVQEVVERTLMPLGRLISQAFLMLAVFGLMVVLVPLLSAALFLSLSAAYGAFFVFLRPIIQRDGRNAVALHRLRHRLATEALGAIKEIRLAQLEDLYTSRFSSASEGIASLTSRKTVMSEMPKLVLEALIFMALIAVGATLAANGTPQGTQFLPTVLLAAAAGLKLFPLVNQIYAQATNIVSGLPILDQIEAFEATLEPSLDTVAAPVLTHTVALKAVTFRYPNADVPLFHDLDLTVSIGESLAIVGPSGVGKSTLIDIIAGIRAPEQGSLLVDGRPLAANQLRNWQTQLRYCPQMPTLFDLTAQDNICGGASFDIERYQNALCTVGLAPDTAWVNNPQPVGENGGRLSGGQIRRVGLARAFYGHARLYILDEPTSGLDRDTADRLVDQVVSLTKTAALIIVTHDTALAARCDRQITLKGLTTG